jgi:hypothetical protein
VFGGDRLSVKASSAEAALGLLLSMLRSPD